MELLPALQSKAEVLRYFSTVPALLAEHGSPEPSFSPAQAKHFFSALHSNGMAIVGFEIWRKTAAGYEMDVEGMWLSQGSDARWNYADAVAFLRIAAPGADDLVTIRFQDLSA